MLNIRKCKPSGEDGLYTAALNGGSDGDFNDYALILGLR
jgi:hypothetical protein